MLLQSFTLTRRPTFNHFFSGAAQHVLPLASVVKARSSVGESVAAGVFGITAYKIAGYIAMSLGCSANRLRRTKRLQMTIAPAFGVIGKRPVGSVVVLVSGEPHWVSCPKEMANETSDLNVPEEICS